MFQDYISISRRLLQKLRKIQDYIEVPAGISAKQYQQGWKKAKESKSSGGKIIHFGHCKCMAQDNRLAELDTAFLSIPL